MSLHFINPLNKQRSKKKKKRYKYFYFYNSAETEKHERTADTTAAQEKDDGRDN